MKDKDYYRIRPEFERCLPALFPSRGTPPPPVKHGINREIVSQMKGRISATQVKGFLWRWFSRPEYLAAVAAGGLRHDIEGRPCDGITEEERAHARNALVQRIAREVVASRSPVWVRRTLSVIRADDRLRADITTETARLLAETGQAMTDRHKDLLAAVR